MTLNKERRLSLFQWVVTRFYYKKSIDQIKESIVLTFDKDCKQGREERRFLTDLVNELEYLKSSYITTDHPDATDLWRENLKAWNLRQREVLTVNAAHEFLNALDGGNRATLNHYKGEF